LETNELLKIWAQHPKVKELAALTGKGYKRIKANGLTGSAMAMAMAAMACNDKKRPFLCILNDNEEAGYFYNDINHILNDDDKVLFFPSSYRRAIKYNQKDSGNEVMRTEVLARLMQQSPAKAPLIVSYPEALSEMVVSKNEMAASTLTLAVGESHDMSSLEDKFMEWGFQRTDYVYEPGQFAIRGSIIDIFSFSSEYPVRIDFFGDDIETIRIFDVQSQLSVKDTDSITIIPEDNGEATSYSTLLGFLPSNTIVVTKDRNFLIDKISQLENEGIAEQSKIVDEAHGNSSVLTATLASKDKFNDALKQFKSIDMGNSGNAANEQTVAFSTTAQPIYHKDLDLLCDDLKHHIRNGYKVFILADNSKQTDRLREIFVSGVKGDADDKTEITFTPIDKTIHEGFIDNDTKMCLFTDHQIFNRFHKYSLKSDRIRSGKMAMTLKEISQLEIGDFVVHVDHGIGQFGGLVRLPNGNATQETIKIIYRDNAAIYVSIHALDKVSKYRGKDGETPRLSSLGTGAWQRMKSRVKDRVKDIARDLIKLYAKRKAAKGFAFSPDGYMQCELEASFEFEDTPDQRQATIDVKNDMERPLPMDRLICGDVGFGKTEIAVRAACKAANDGKQTALLVPTTVLAYQHYKTFAKRLEEFPITVDYLTRARTPKETKQTLKNLEEGKVDVIIGTQKLIGKGVKFKDLGLLIIDEEQKFGVGVKEKLRQAKANIDTLTMTATPIPRTLQFSLMGARDLSVMRTPPPNRHPIHTEILPFSSEIIYEAINFEMSRNGQVFLVNDRVNNLADIAANIKKNIPDARVCIAHGQMHPKDLEDIVFGFINYEYDVMISTTIVENGVDIPNANTIIINNAHRYGLSDLHQMRGRVGRSDKKAFCYLIAPPLALLSDDARRRLQAVENFSELGSGMNIALQDLDIRGAGNMLGAEQSGFIADLGYETYQKVLKEAIQELKEQEFADVFEDNQNETEDDSSKKTENKKKIANERQYVEECTFDCDFDLYFPEMYVPSSGERMALYRELNNLTTKQQLEDYRKRIIDRFGKIPKEGEQLIQVMPLKWAACKMGITKIVMKQGIMILHLVTDINSPYYMSDMFNNIISYISYHPRRFNLRDKGYCVITVKNVQTVGEALNVLEEMSKVDNLNNN